LLLRQIHGTNSVVRSVRVLVFIDDEHGHEPLSAVGQSNRYWSGIEIEDCCGIEGVTVSADERAFAKTI
jgi:hypothetical protein